MVRRRSPRSPDRQDFPSRPPTGLLPSGWNGATCSRPRWWVLNRPATLGSGGDQPQHPVATRRGDAVSRGPSLRHQTTRAAAILDGTDALYIERLSSRQSSAIMSRPGRRLPFTLPAWAGSSRPGDDVFIDNYLAKDLTSFHQETMVEASALRQRLGAIRRQGFARTDEELHEGAVSIAHPVRDRTGTVIAAMSIVIPLETATGPPSRPSCSGALWGPAGFWATESTSSPKPDTPHSKRMGKEKTP